MNMMAIACLFGAIVFIPVCSALAGTVESNPADTARKAATEVVKDTGAKQKFGKTENGDRLIDKAKGEASQKLTNLAEEADSRSDLPDSKKLFLKKLNLSQ